VNAFDRARDAAKSSTTPLSKRAETAYAVAKTDDETRDADDEFADAEELQKACWDYVRSGYRAIRDTHTNVEIGELVELVSWPYEVEAEARTGDGQVFKYKLPENTVYAGVIWQPPAWELYKQGKLRGYSLGGKAVRLKEAADSSTLPLMRDMVVVDDVVSAQVGKADTPIPNKPGKTNWVEEAGGLPAYIRKIAEDLVDKHGVSGAIRLAVGIVKRWCRGEGNVTAKTRAKACKAVAEWEKKKASSHAKKGGWEEPSLSELVSAELELSATVLAKALDDDEPLDLSVEHKCDCGCGG
jgi:hypothetical protein